MVGARFCRAVSGKPYLLECTAGGVFHSTCSPGSSTCSGVPNSAHTAEAAGADTLFLRTAAQRLGFVIPWVSYQPSYARWLAPVHFHYVPFTSDTVLLITLPIVYALDGILIVCIQSSADRMALSVFVSVSVRTMGGPRRCAFHSDPRSSSHESCAHVNISQDALYMLP